MSFKDDVFKWTKDSSDKMARVRRRAVVYLGEELTRTKPQGGRVPVLTGNLARSLLASTSGMPEDGNGGDVGVVANGLSLNSPVWLGYQAAYARRRNYGFIGQDSLGRTYNEAGDHFVEGAIAEWDNIVKKAVRDVIGNG